MLKKRKSGSNELIKQIILAENLIFKDFEHRLKPIGVSRAQAEVLLVVKSNEPLSLNQLAEQLPSVTTPPSRLVSSLVNKRLIKRTDNPQDRRNVKLTLTKKGQEIAKKVAIKQRLVERSIENNAKAKQIEDCIKTLKNITGYT